MECVATSINQRIFDTTIDLILVTNDYGRFIQVSPSCEPILGYTQQNMEGQLATKFLHPDDLPATRQEMRLARLGKVIRAFECRYVHKDGHAVALTWTGVWVEPEKQYVFIGREKIREFMQHRLGDITTRLTKLDTTIAHKDLGRMSDIYLNDLTMIACSFWAAYTLLVHPVFATYQNAFWLIGELQLQQRDWGLVVLCAAIFKLVFLCRRPLHLNAQIGRIARSIGYALSATFWSLIGISDLWGNPDTLFGFVGVVLGARSWWAIVRILIL